MTKRVLNDLTIELTNRCQLRCRACAIWRESERHEISASGFARILQTLMHEHQIRFVSVTGGEPFLHAGISGILNFLSVLKSRRAITGFGVYTNGVCTTRIKQVLQQKRAALKGLDFGVSVDGDQKTHDYLRGNGAYRRTLKTLEWVSCACRDTVKLELKFTISRMNYDQVEHVFDLALRLGARFSPKMMEDNVAAYYHRGGMKDAAGLAGLTSPMRKEVRRQIAGLIHNGGAAVDGKMLSMLLCLIDGGRTTIKACATPAKSLFITSQGYIYPCLYMLPAGRFDMGGVLAPEYLGARGALIRIAKTGTCPGCYAYHGFLKHYNEKNIA